MGKFTSYITPQHWLQLKCFLFNHLWHLMGFTILSYSCFSAGMYDNCVIMLIDWQEAPLGYSVLCIAAVNNYETPTWKSLEPG